jgi:hypothetical protein
MLSEFLLNKKGIKIDVGFVSNSGIWMSLIQNSI